MYMYIRVYYVYRTYCAPDSIQCVDSRMEIGILLIHSTATITEASDLWRVNP